MGRWGCAVPHWKTIAGPAVTHMPARTWKVCFFARPLSLTANSVDGRGTGLLGCRWGLAPGALVPGRTYPWLLDVSFTNPKAKRTTSCLNSFLGVGGGVRSVILQEEVVRCLPAQMSALHALYKVITHVPKGVDVLCRMNDLLLELRFLALKPHFGGGLGNRINVFKVPFDI